MISIEEYNIAERQAAKFCTNRKIEAFMPTAYAFTGYPVTIDDESVLHKYLDVMQEGRLKETVDKLLFGLRPDELEAVIDIAKKTYQMSKSSYDFGVVPHDSLIRSILALRHIRELHPAGGLVFEAGPGSGYLTALLVYFGYRVVSMDVAQAFYLVQNHLWNNLFPGDVEELATTTTTLEEAVHSSTSKIIHVPWWVFASEDTQHAEIKFDCATANHMFGEMHQYARTYMIKLLSKWLSKPNSPQTSLVAESLGLDLGNSHIHTFATLQNYGFTQVYRERSSYIFTLNEQTDLKTEEKIQFNSNLDKVRTTKSMRNKVSYTEIEDALRNISDTGSIATRDEEFFNFIDESFTIDTTPIPPINQDEWKILVEDINSKIMGYNQIYVYGTGDFSSKLYEETNLKDMPNLIFVDKDAATKTTFYGCKVILPQELQKTESQCIIVGSYNYRHEIFATLKSKTFVESDIIIAR